VYKPNLGIKYCHQREEALPIRVPQCKGTYSDHIIITTIIIIIIMEERVYSEL